MNLIEQLGGYCYARRMSQDWKSSIDGDIPLDTMMYSYDFGIFSWGDLQYALLEYRRQHNIYEVGDFIVSCGSCVEWSDDVLTIKEVRSNTVVTENFDFVFTFGSYRHATDEEIKAGKRL